jgi:hypothetical protein
VKCNDIHVCAFPKSGITFFGFLLVAARLRHNGIELTPTMYNIDFLLIDKHKMAGVDAAGVWRDGIGDLYKTHDPFFSVPNVVYLLRDPVPTLRSYYHFRRQLGSQETPEQFLLGPDGIAGWIRHVRSWLIDNRTASQSLFVTEYERLRAQPLAELRWLGQQLGLLFSNQTLEHAVAAASLERMRELEAAFVARNPVYAQFGLEFVRRGEQREVDQITPALVELIRRHTQPTYEAARSRLRNPDGSPTGGGAH